MSAAISDHIVDLSAHERRKITHAGLADNYMQRLPSFEEASVDEVLDIKRN